MVLGRELVLIFDVFDGGDGGACISIVTAKLTTYLVK
jgi:hypothetical protein